MDLSWCRPSITDIIKAVCVCVCRILPSTLHNRLDNVVTFISLKIYLTIYSARVLVETSETIIIVRFKRKNKLEKL